MKNFHQRAIILILAFFFVCVCGLIGMTFLSHTRDFVTESRTIKAPIDKVWTSVADRQHYLRTRKEIIRYSIQDSIKPNWVEYYGVGDSLINKTVVSVPQSKFHYVAWSNKYLQVTGYKIQMQAIDSHSTHVSISEKTQYYNHSADVYMNILKPKASLNYEFLKITNTLNYLDSLGKTI